MGPHIVEKVIDRVSNAVSKIEFFTIGNHYPILNHTIQFLVHSLNKILSRRFQK